MTSKENQLPSVPSPADTGHVVKNKSTAAGREFWGHVEAIAKQVRNPKWVPEPVSPEGSGPCICHQGPGSVGALRPCPIHGVTAAPEAAAEDVPKSYNDFLRKYYPATAEKLIAESAAPIAPAAVSGLFDAWWIEHRWYGYASNEELAVAAWNAAVSSQTANAEGDGWIAVTERLPEDGEPVLIVWSGVVQHLTYARFEGGWYPYHEDPDDFPQMDEDAHMVTLWRKLPTPPSVQEEKGSSE